MANEEKRIKNRVSRQVTATDAQIDKFLLSLQRFLNLNVKDIKSRLKDGKVSAQEAASVMGGLLTELENKGLNKEVAKLKDIFAGELRFIMDEFEEQGISEVFSAADKNTVNALINVELSKTDLEIRHYGVDLQAAVMNQIVAGQDFGKVLAERPEKLDKRLLAGLKAEINTAVMAFNRTITANKAEELGLNLFLYVGANDDITRPFCARLLDRNPPIYTKDEIDKMDNDQGLSVMTYGGGYNCRHHWRAVTKELAESLGYRG